MVLHTCDPRTRVPETVASQLQATWKVSWRPAWITLSQKKKKDMWEELEDICIAEC